MPRCSPGGTPRSWSKCSPDEARRIRLMFFLAKRDDVWTLTHEVGPLRRVALVGCGIAGLALPAYLSVRAGAFDRTALAATVGVVVALGLVAYWTLSDAASSAVFDL